MSSPEERIIEIVQASEASEIKFSVRFERDERPPFIEIMRFPVKIFSLVDNLGYPNPWEL